MSPDTIHATQASLVIQCETVGTVLLDHGFGAKTARIGHMAKSCLEVLEGLSPEACPAVVRQPLCASTSATFGDP